MQMEKTDGLATCFEETRHHLKSVAYRMLGSVSEAEDAIQETWIRLTRSESENIENLNGWLTTVVARICLDMLRSRKSRREDSLDESAFDIPDEGSENPETDFILADSIGQALLVMLDTLTPAERIAFVLHDCFDLPFEEIAPIIDRTGDATRQLASRARRRVRGRASPQENRKLQQEAVSAFLAASRKGDFDALIKLLNPDVILRADEVAVKTAEANKSNGAPQFKREISGARGVADTFKGKAAAVQLALVNGIVGATWAPQGKPVVAFCFTLENGKISVIDVVMEPEKLADIDIELINNEDGYMS